MVNILLVDDDAAYRELIFEFLTDAGYDVTACDNGKDAIDLLKKRRFQILLTDIILPWQTGNEVIQAAAALPSPPRIVAMSGGGRAENMAFLDIAKRQGADGALRKPFDLDDLLETVSALATPPA